MSLCVVIQGLWDTPRIGYRELLLTLQPVAETLPIHVRHDVEEEAVGFT